MKLFGESKVMSIDELNAYRTAYGNPLMKKEIFTALVVPFMVSFFSVYVLTYYWWLSLIAGIIGVSYGFIVLMKISVERIYQQESMIQRNRFINTMTGLLANPDEMVVTALRWCAREITKGELKKELDQLIIDLMDATPNQVQSAFNLLKDKYKSDFVFGLFMDNLVTASLEGRTDIKKIKELKTWHNDVLEQRNMFINNKVLYKRQFKATTIYPLIVVGILTFARGFDAYLLYYAHNVIGWVCSAILIGALCFYFHSLQMNLADDEVMEVKMWRK
ncbi:hypothetical protein [Niallia taxi]|uniref:hypothetical protein n=1 Tax=Niallia taxi TaxID=2499688 RepID=UPI002E1AB390|nr:hypothetical protein [Niallia taxi]